MTTYKYETHLHTKEGSACGASRGEEYIKPYIEAGYDGIFVTDHFFGGNTAAPRDADWATRINWYCSGYENALKAAQKYNEENGTDFKVFFGIEQTFDGDDYLVYGLDKEWLLAHPEIETMRHAQLFEAVKSFNGLMIQAHPFRYRSYMRDMHQHPLEVHGIEVYNGGNNPIENDMAALFAKRFNFPVTSGSDIHDIKFIPDAPGKNPIGGMEFDTPLTDVFDYVERVKFSKGRPILP